MTIALVAHTQKTHTGPSGTTTTAIDTTGANFILVFWSNVNSNAGTLSDSNSNTWSSPIAYSQKAGSKVYYAENATVGSGHTFTMSGTNIYADLWVAAFSGVATSSSFESSDGDHGANSGTSYNIGSVTPTVDGDLIYAVVHCGGSTTGVTSGFTELDSTTGEGSTAYMIQGTAGAQSCTFTGDTSGQWGGSIQCFKAAGGAASNLFVPLVGPGGLITPSGLAGRRGLVG